ncbi:MAG TPA: glycosyltransferase [Candidatus Hydrogenedentes bacterium]|nr:glycosyltransferase [Candidatus Hydrogenedentota bacterium]HOV75045.1 glycosyltransferase [Candidatus Hydrogenedentota bacterium]
MDPPGKLTNAPPPEKDTLAVSVVMPCYNARETVSRALDSLRAQTLPDWELILVDDGSDDGTLAVLREAASRDDRLRVIARNHEGIVSALQYGCQNARGSFIARMDADDSAHPDRFRRQVEFMRAHPDVDLCGTGVKMTGGRIGYGRRRYEKWINALVSHEEIVRDLFVECPLAHPTFFMRRDAFEAVGGYQDRGWAEDYDLIMRMALAGKRFGKVAEPLLDWTESPKRLSMRDPRYSPENFRALKRYYLGQSHLRGRSAFHQWGAGEVGKAWLREWDVMKPLAVADINPRKVGRRIHGIPVIWPDILPGPGETFIVVAVGAPTAREEIRAWLIPRGYRELRDFVFLA